MPGEAHGGGGVLSDTHCPCMAEPNVANPILWHCRAGFRWSPGLCQEAIGLSEGVISVLRKSGEGQQKQNTLLHGVSGMAGVLRGQPIHFRLI